jgi:hypothetical protein
MDNAGILGAIERVMVSLYSGNVAVVKVAKEQLIELLNKLEFEEKIESKEKIDKKLIDDLITHFSSIGTTIIGKRVQQSTIGKGIPPTIESLIERNKDLEKQLHEFFVKIQNGELVEKVELERVFTESNNWRNAFYDAFNLVRTIESKWYFKLFGNLDKAQREIALEKAINEKM